MNDKNKKIDNDQILEDSLDKTIHEVAHVSDLELAHQFLYHNNDAIHNPNAVFTNIDSVKEKELEVEGLDQIDESLRIKTLKDVKLKKINFKQLLAEDYRKKFWKKKWNQLINIFKLENRTYKHKFDYHFESEDWKKYERNKIKRKREKEIKHNDFLTYTDLQLRETKKLKKIWILEILVTLTILILAIAFIVLITNVNQGFIINDGTFLGFLLQNIKISIYVFSILAILTFIIPYFFLFTSWFVSINDVHKSRNFQYFTIIFLITACVLILVATGLTIAYYAYSFTLWIPS